MNSSSMAGGKRGSQVAQDDLRGGAVIAKEPVGAGRCGELSHAEFQDEKLEALAGTLSLKDVYRRTPRIVSPDALHRLTKVPIVTSGSSDYQYRQFTRTAGFTIA